MLAEYRDQVDFVYLFANQNVLEFYPKFGFQAQQETLLSCPDGARGPSPCATQCLASHSLKYIIPVTSPRFSRGQISSRLFPSGSGKWIFAWAIPLWAVQG